MKLVALRLRNTPVLWSWQSHIILLLLLDLKFAPDVNCRMMKGHKRSLLLAVTQRRQPTAGDLRRQKALCFNSHITQLLQQATVSGCHGSNGWSPPMQTTSRLRVTAMFVRFSASRSSNIQTWQVCHSVRTPATPDYASVLLFMNPVEYDSMQGQ